MNVLIKFQTIDWLVNNGASINMCEGSQRTPLHLAVATGRADVVQYLITKGKRSPLLSAQISDAQR